MNLVQELIDRHLIAGRGEQGALIEMGDGGSVAGMTFRDLAIESNRAAFVLRGVGVVPGDRVLIARPLDTSTVFAVLGVLRNGAVAVFSTGAESPPAAERDGIAVAIADESLPRKQYPGLREVFDADLLRDRMRGARDVFRSTSCALDTPAIALSDGLSDSDVSYVHPHGLGQALAGVASRWLGAPDDWSGEAFAIAPDLSTSGKILALFALMYRGRPTLLPGRARDPLTWWRAAEPGEPRCVVGSPEFLDELPATASLRRVAYSVASGDLSGPVSAGSARALLVSVNGVPFRDPNLEAIARLDGAPIEGAQQQ